MASSVLVLQRFQPFGLRDLHPAKPSFPFVDTGVTHAVLPAQIGDRNASLKVGAMARECRGASIANGACNCVTMRPSGGSTSSYAMIARRRHDRTRPGRWISSLTSWRAIQASRGQDSRYLLAFLAEASHWTFHGLQTASGPNASTLVPVPWRRPRKTWRLGADIITKNGPMGRSAIDRRFCCTATSAQPDPRYIETGTLPAPR
ncbi:hypothetical protein SAMN05216573_13111 [Bradyrhizobium sp. Rc3b]|nr:hypothetical protein SAMN05216573_13111 [Bradyrhizobium sp. Rc3b]